MFPAAFVQLTGILPLPRRYGPVLASMHLMRYSPSIIGDQVNRRMVLNWRHDNFLGRAAIVLALCCCMPVYAGYSIILGPYDTKEDLIRSSTFLSNHQIPYELNDDAITESLGYIVVTDQISAAEARRIIRALKLNGIKDFLYVSRGVYVDRISAGIFKAEKSANTRIAKLAQSGEKFIAMERTRTIASATIRVFLGGIPISLMREFESTTGATLSQLTRHLLVEEPESIQEFVEPEVESISQPEVSTGAQIGAVPEIEPAPEIETTPEIETVPEIETALKIETVPEIETATGLETIPEVVPVPETVVVPEVDVVTETGAVSEIEVVAIEVPEIESLPEYSLPIEPVEPEVTSPNIVTRTQLPQKQAFPLIPFLLVAIVVLILLGLAYYYFGRRVSVKPNDSIAQVKKAAPDQSKTGAKKLPDQPEHAAKQRPDEPKPAAKQLPDKPKHAAKQLQDKPKHPAKQLQDKPKQDADHPIKSQLKASINAIVAFANQILSGMKPAAEEIPQIVETIRSGDADKLDLIGNILELSRIDSGLLEIVQISFDPTATLQRIVKSLSHTAEQRGLTLDFQQNDNLPGLITSDHAKLDTILVGMINHAIDYAPSGSVLISADFSDKSESFTVTIEHSINSDDIEPISKIIKSVDSFSNIDEEEHIRLAVSNRLSRLMGGDIRIENGPSASDIKYIITVHADKVLEKEQIEPPGVNVENALPSAATSSEQLDKTQNELEGALRKAEDASRAQIKAESRLNNERTARTKAQSRATKLIAVKKQAEIEIAKRKVALGKASDQIKELSSALENAREAIDNKNVSESEQANKLEKELQQVNSEVLTLKNELEIQVNAQQESETRATNQITGLQDALEEAEANAEARAKEAASQLHNVAESEAQLAELQVAMSATDAHLTTELELLSRTKSEAESQAQALERQLEDARKESREESAARLELEERLNRMTSELEELNHSLDVQRTGSQKENREFQHHLKRLAQGLKEAKLNAERSTLENKVLEEASNTNLTSLQEKLDNAQQQLTKEKEQREDSLTNARKEAETLRSQIAETENSINSDLSQQKEISDSLVEEVTSLKTALLTAEENLNSEVDSRDREEEISTSQMEALVNDVNQAKATVQKEAEIRAELELQTQNQLDSMTAEVQENKQALDRAKEEAAQNARAVSIARQKLRQLAAGELSTDQGDGQTPLHSSMPMNNPILNAMVRRFIKRLKHQLSVMENSYKEEKYIDIMVITDWVKSESLKLGFEELHPPVASLELCLRRQEFEPIEIIIKQLQNMAERIEITDEQIDDGSSLGVKAQESNEPIPFTLPDSDRKAELLENFVSQLGSKLLEMQSAWQEGNTDILTKVCNWILKYGTRLDVPEIIESAQRLDSSLKQKDADRVSQRLWDFIGIYSRIEIVQG